MAVAEFNCQQYELSLLEVLLQEESAYVTLVLLTEMSNTPAV